MQEMSPQMRNAIKDSLMYAILFYILSHKQMYTLTSGIFPTFIKDRVFLHGVVYMFLYIVIQKITQRV
jgi:hypothetical protein